MDQREGTAWVAALWQEPSWCQDRLHRCLICAGTWSPKFRTAPFCAVLST